MLFDYNNKLSSQGNSSKSSLGILIVLSISSKPELPRCNWTNWKNRGVNRTSRQTDRTHCAVHLRHSLCVPFDLVGEVAYQTIPCSRVKIASINMSTQVWSFIFGHLCEIDMRRDICMYAWLGSRGLRRSGIWLIIYMVLKPGQPNIISVMFSFF